MLAVGHSRLCLGKGLGEAGLQCQGLGAQQDAASWWAGLWLPGRESDSAQKQKWVAWVRVFKEVHTALGMLRMKLEEGRG